MLKRSLSFNATARQIIRPPIQVHGVEGRYASALYAAAHRINKLDAVDRDLQSVKKAYGDSKTFKEFTKDPTLRAANKKKGVLAVLEKVKVSKEVENFLVLLAENGRLNKLEAVINSFETIMGTHRGEILVRITSAEPLTKKHETALTEALQKFVKSNQKLNVEMVVKPSILGGLIVNIGDRYVDMSIATRVKKMEQVLQSAV